MTCFWSFVRLLLLIERYRICIHSIPIGFIDWLVYGP